MHSISLITAALAATVSAAPAQKRDLHLKGQITMTVNNSTLGCMGLDMMWTVSGKCATYQVERVVAWNDQGWAWKLEDLKGNNCGPLGKYQSCDKSITRDNYYAWDTDYSGLTNGTWMGDEYVTQLPKKDADVPVLSHHKNLTNPIRFDLTWRSASESGKEKNRKTTLPHTG